MKNIDIVKAGKNSEQNSKKDHIYHVPRDVKPKIKSKPKKIKPSGLGVWFALKSGLSSIFSSDIFLPALLRNIFSLRTTILVLIPIIYFQIKYFIVLKPDQVLSRLKSFISPQNTFQFVGLGLVVLVAIILSWLADTIILPALYRYKYQKIDNRPVKIFNSLKESLRNMGSFSANKIYKCIIAVIIFMILIAFMYFVYILGYGSLKSQLWLSVPVLVVFGLIFLIYAKFRLCMQAFAAVGLNSDQNKFGLAFKQSFLRPLYSIQQGFVWLIALLFPISASVMIVLAETSILNSGRSIGVTILYLSFLTTLIYMVWSAWTSFQVGFTSALANYERPLSKLHFQVDDENGYFGFWIVVIMILITIAIYFAVSFAFSSQISDILVGIWEKLPDTIRVNIPKPN